MPKPDRQVAETSNCQTSFADGRSLFLHGGGHGSGEVTSPALLHLGSQRWEAESTAGAAAGRVSDHTLTPVARNRLLQYGCTCYPPLICMTDEAKAELRAAPPAAVAFVACSCDWTAYQGLFA